MKTNQNNNAYYSTRKRVSMYRTRFVRKNNRIVLILFLTKEFLCDKSLYFFKPREFSIR